MYSDIPNMISTFGYISASWTLRADIIAEYTCRLINYVDSNGVRQCTPRLRDDEKTKPAILVFYTVTRCFQHTTWSVRNDGPVWLGYPHRCMTLVVSA